MIQAIAPPYLTRTRSTPQGRADGSPSLASSGLCCCWHKRCSWFCCRWRSQILFLCRIPDVITHAIAQQCLLPCGLHWAQDLEEANRYEAPEQFSKKPKIDYGTSVTFV